MSTSSLVRTQPPAALIDVERERDSIARDFARHWPRAVGNVLRLAARAGAHNRRAAALGLAPILFDPPLSAAEAMWAEIALQDAAASSAQPGPGTRAGRPRAR